MAPPAGFEPATLSLTATCSTAELQGNGSAKGNLPGFLPRAILPERSRSSRAEPDFATFVWKDVDQVNEPAECSKMRQ